MPGLTFVGRVLSEVEVASGILRVGDFNVGIGITCISMKSVRRVHSRPSSVPQSLFCNLPSIGNASDPSPASMQPRSCSYAPSPYSGSIVHMSSTLKSLKLGLRCLHI